MSGDSAKMGNLGEIRDVGGTVSAMEAAAMRKIK
jgi:hypothetical protein